MFKYVHRNKIYLGTFNITRALFSISPKPGFQHINPDPRYNCSDFLSEESLIMSSDFTVILFVEVIVDTFFK